MAIRKLQDEIIIYFSKEDGCWIAHSLRTDQIGTGGRIVDALADALKAIDEVFDLAARDKTVAHLREAPAEVKRKVKRSARLPREIYEIAHQKARGHWPKDWTAPELKGSQVKTFRAEFHGTAA